MVDVMQRPDRLLAEDAFLSFVPLIDDVPDQAVGGVGFDLPQAFLTAILTFGPARTLNEPQGWLREERTDGTLSRVDVHGLRGVRLRTGDQTFSPKVEVGADPRNGTKYKKASCERDYCQSNEY